MARWTGRGCRQPDRVAGLGGGGWRTGRTQAHRRGTEALSDPAYDLAVGAAAGKVTSGARERGKGQRAASPTSPQHATGPVPALSRSRNGLWAELTRGNSPSKSLLASLSKWVLRPSINDDWLPRQQPGPYFISWRCRDAFAGYKRPGSKGRGPSLPPLPGPDPGGL